MAKAKGEHYVDNKVFLQAMIEWKEKCKLAEEADDEKPPVTNYIGECFLKIATHLSYRPNFINYTYKDDMISDGIENCLQYASNFNPEKSNNPFAYFTQIIYYAFIRRIQKEKKQTHVKNRSQQFRIKSDCGRKKWKKMFPSVPLWALRHRRRPEDILTGAWGPSGPFVLCSLCF